MFKVKTGEAPTFMKEIFSINLNTENVSANTCSQSLFYTPNIPKKVNTGLQTVRYMGPKIWDMVPNETKNVAALSIFKNKIRNCTFLKCMCRLCLEYIPNLGFVEIILSIKIIFSIYTEYIYILKYICIYFSIFLFCFALGFFG